MQSNSAKRYSVERVETYEFPLTKPSNYYIVDIDGSRILVDTGAHEVLKTGDDVVGVLLTHWHWDHSRGLVGLRDKIVCASRETISMLSSIRNIERSVLRPLRAMGISIREDSDPISGFFRSILAMYSKIIDGLKNNIVFEYSECPLRKLVEFEVFPCPGHTDDHNCIVIGDTIFVGDNATLGESPTTINYRDYMHTVHRILAGKWETLAPGHGNLLDRGETVEYFSTVIDRKNKRMARVVASLAKGITSFNDLLKYVYGLKPEPQAYVPARTLIGYLRLLEHYRLAEIQWESSPLQITFLG